MDDKDNQISLKSSQLRSRLCDYSDSYIIFKRTVTVVNTASQCANRNDGDKKGIFKNCAPFTNSISRINHTQVDDTLLLL